MRIEQLALNKNLPGHDGESAPSPHVVSGFGRAGLREGADTPGLTAGTFCGAGPVLMVHFVLRAYLPTKTIRTCWAAQSVSLNPGVCPGFRKVQSKLYYEDSICWNVIVISTA